MCTVERWGLFEVSVRGASEGNPFVERNIRATFEGIHERVTVDSFYDGDGIYKVRFMPSFEGDYTYIIEGNYGGEAAGGSFRALSASGNNHGPVHVASMYHFAYADGTPYYSIGTTCYVWDLQSDERIAETLQTLKNSAFSKIRFCVFPKHYDYNLREPRSYPYEGTPMDPSVLTRENFQQYTFKSEGNSFDYTRFNPAHFRHVEWCIEQLQQLGIEADIIMMHPYDRWGFCTMTKEQLHGHGGANTEESRLNNKQSRSMTIIYVFRNAVASQRSTIIEQCGYNLFRKEVLFSESQTSNDTRNGTFRHNLAVCAEHSADIRRNFPVSCVDCALLPGIV